MKEIETSSIFLVVLILKKNFATSLMFDKPRKNLTEKSRLSKKEFRATYSRLIGIGHDRFLNICNTLSVF